MLSRIVRRARSATRRAPRGTSRFVSRRGGAAAMTCAIHDGRTLNVAIVAGGELTLSVEGSPLRAVPPTRVDHGTARWTLDLADVLVARAEPYPIMVSDARATRPLSGMRRVEAIHGQATDGPPVPGDAVVSTLTSRRGRLAIAVARPRPRVHSIVPVEGARVSVRLGGVDPGSIIVAARRGHADRIVLARVPESRFDMDLTSLATAEGGASGVWDLAVEDPRGVRSPLGAPAADVADARGVVSFPQIGPAGGPLQQWLKPYPTASGTVAIAVKNAVEGGEP